MHPELFTLPGGISIKTYGAFLALGFLSAVWLAMRRASRVKADPDRVLDMSFLALVFGVLGSRVFFVVHYWEAEFASRPNVLWAVVDIRQGGLEFLGGLIGAALAICVYVWRTRISLRLYLDVLAPSTMWGLAIGRLGCFFNGCCFGGACLAADGHSPQFPWAMRFPYGSNPHVRQWEDRQVAVPAELLDTHGILVNLIPGKALDATVDRREAPRREVERLTRLLEDARKKSGGDDAVVKELETRLRGARARWDSIREELGLESLDFAQKFPSRRVPTRPTSVSEIESLAAAHPSLPIHPTQLYAAAHAAILSGLLSAVYYTRKRHGIVFGLMLVMYPVGRFLLEVIRADNPHDVAGLTISQFTALSLGAVGLAYLWYVRYRLPERSPRAVPAPGIESESK